MQAAKPLRVWRYGDARCAAEGCGRKIRANGMCGAHLERIRRGTGIQASVPVRDKEAPPRRCSVSGCDREHRGRGYCAAHMSRIARVGHPQADMPVRTNTGRYIDDNGYVQTHVKAGHPFRPKRQRVPEHRMVMEIHLGRPLRSGETVHHKNGIRHDNRLENLEPWASSHPYGQRVVDLIAWARELLATYAPEEDALLAGEVGSNGPPEEEDRR